MNLNNWLCKKFDEEKKGYVTIRDILIVAFIVPILKNFEILSGCTMAFVLVGMFSALIQGFVTNDYPSNPSEMLYVILKGWIIPAIIIMSLYVLYLLSSIKIAKCPLKEDKQ